MNTTYTVKHIQKGPTLFIDPFYRKEEPVRAESLRWTLRQVITESGTQEGKA